MKCALGTLKLYNCYFVLLGEGVLLRLLFVLLVLQYADPIRITCKFQCMPHNCWAYWYIFYLYFSITGVYSGSTY